MDTSGEGNIVKKSSMNTSHNLVARCFIVRLTVVPSSAYSICCLLPLRWVDDLSQWSRASKRRPLPLGRDQPQSFAAHATSDHTPTSLLRDSELCKPSLGDHKVISQAEARQDLEATQRIVEKFPKKFQSACRNSAHPCSPHTGTTTNMSHALSICGEATIWTSLGMLWRYCMSSSMGSAGH